MAKPMAAEALYLALEREFRPEECTEVFPVIGLQYHNTDAIEKVYTATFASHEVLDALEARGATDCMLFTHHPVPQKKDLFKPNPPIPESIVERLKQNRITLFSYHIPLDRNSEWSPGTNFAKHLGLHPFGEFFEQNKVRMGLLCNSGFSALKELCAAVESMVGHPIKVYPYGGETILGGKVAVMCGGADQPGIYPELREMGINTFITGIANPAIGWVNKNHEAAKAAGVTILGAGHYSTEKYAPMETVRFFESLGLAAEFIPETQIMEEM